ncbi:ALF repeat-containing protein [Streptomyces sp. NPDC047971]|uniref:ALF repeat-containing protein n=1 Tax=Streptomyces sp. NPDC047971 TaxID=3154499 RepID=UPI0033DAAD2F
MKTTRAALVMAATALTPALLLATPAVAAASAPVSTPAASAIVTPETPVDEMSEADLRIAILRILADEDSGRGVVREANEALDGTVQDMRAFLKTGYRLAQAEDDHVAVFTILAAAQKRGDKAVVREAVKALELGTPEAWRAFLETGYRIAQAEDDRVAVFTILHSAQKNGDRAVVREAVKALELGTPEALRKFVETGYRLAQAEDDRVAVFTILADPTISPALRAAAEDVIDGTPEELRHFLEVGRYEVGR